MNYIDNQPGQRHGLPLWWRPQTSVWWRTIGPSRPSATSSSSWWRPWSGWRRTQREAKSDKERVSGQIKITVPCSSWPWYFAHFIIRLFIGLMYLFLFLGNRRDVIELFTANAKEIPSTHFHHSRNKKDMMRKETAGTHWIGDLSGRTVSPYWGDRPLLCPSKPSHRPFPPSFYPLTHNWPKK